MDFNYNDGGRKAAGFTNARDSVTRSIAIVTGQSYMQVFSALTDEAKRDRPGRFGKKIVKNKGFSKSAMKRYLKKCGYRWVPAMGIGTGCRVRLRNEDIPPGRIIVSVSKHFSAIIDHTINDTFDPSRGGTRCVYGFFVKSNSNIH
jgi:hypothetical protein